MPPFLKVDSMSPKSKDDAIFIGEISKKSELLSQPFQAPHVGSVEIHLPNGARVAYPVGSGETILDVLLNAGENAPFSCKAGICMSCIAEVEEGCVEQDEVAALTDEDISERKALMCQSRPVSSHVRIRFLDWVSSK